jgi:hypothetical protein
MTSSTNVGMSLENILYPLPQTHACQCVVYRSHSESKSEGVQYGTIQWGRGHVVKKKGWNQTQHQLWQNQVQAYFHTYHPHIIREPTALVRHLCDVNHEDGDKMSKAWLHLFSFNNSPYLPGPSHWTVVPGPTPSPLHLLWHLYIGPFQLSISFWPWRWQLQCMPTLWNSLNT